MPATSAPAALTIPRRDGPEALMSFVMDISYSGWPPLCCLYRSHSPSVMPAPWMTVDHLVSSRSMIAACSSGVVDSGSPPFMARRRPLQLLDAGLIDDLFEQSDLLGHARPGLVGALGAHEQAGLEELVFHLRRDQNLQCLRLQPFDIGRRRLGRRQ